MPDPKTELLFSGNSSMIVCRDEKSDRSNTILIDHKQRIITNKDDFSEILIQYDQRNFPVRVFQNSDVTHNLLTKYETDKEGIVRAVTYEIDTFGWSYSQRQVRNEAFDIETYELDEQNAILTKQSRNNGKIQYIFGKDGRLIQTVTIKPYSEFIKLYFYADGGLSKIYTIADGKKKLSEYFSNNTLDSIVFEDYCRKCHSINASSVSDIEKQ